MYSGAQPVEGKEAQGVGDVDDGAAGTRLDVLPLEGRGVGSGRGEDLQPGLGREDECERAVVGVHVVADVGARGVHWDTGRVVVST